MESMGHREDAAPVLSIVLLAILILVSLAGPSKKGHSDARHATFLATGRQGPLLRDSDQGHRSEWMSPPRG